MITFAEWFLGLWAIAGLVLGLAAWKGRVGEESFWGNMTFFLFLWPMCLYFLVRDRRQWRLEETEPNTFRWTR